MRHREFERIAAADDTVYIGQILDWVTELGETVFAELMGIRAPWLGFRGQHDEHSRTSALVFVDAPDNPGHPPQWFVRTGIFACVCPAPFFGTEAVVAPDTYTRRP